MFRQSIETITKENGQVDVLLLQPQLYLSMLRHEQDPVQNEYWETMNQVGSLGGDQPTEPNLGLLYVAACLEQQGYTVELLDFHMLDYLVRQRDERFLTWQDITQILERKTPRVVGISSMTFSSVRALKLAALCKEIYPRTQVILGGIHPTSLAEEILDTNPWVDFVVCGEGETTMLDLLHCLESGSNPASIPGLALRDTRTGKAIRTPPRPLLENLNALPLPAYHLVPNEISIVPRVISARGCIGNCAFCSPNQFFNKKIRYRDPMMVVDEIEWLKSQFGCTFFVLGDLTFMARPDYGAEICHEIIQRKLGISWWCQTRVDLITPERARLLKAAGCVQVALGIEGASQEQLDLSEKRITPSKALQACAAAKAAGLSVQSYWIVGLPGETVDTAMTTIKMMEYMLAEGMIDVTHISVLVPYPGTSLHAMPNEEGIRIVSHQYDQYLMNCDDFGAGLPVYETPTLSRYQIYALWQLALATAARHYRRASSTTIGQESIKTTFLETPSQQRAIAYKV